MKVRPLSISALALLLLGNSAKAALGVDTHLLAQWPVGRADKRIFFPDIFQCASPDEKLCAAIRIESGKYGPKSVTVCTLLGRLFEMYVRSKRISDAKEVAQKLLDCDLRGLDWSSRVLFWQLDDSGMPVIPEALVFEKNLKFDRFSRNGLIEGSLELAGSKDYATAVILLNHLLEKLKKEVECDDKRVAITLVAIGYIHGQNNNKKDADEMYKAAYDIFKLHDGSSARTVKSASRYSYFFSEYLKWVDAQPAVTESSLAPYSTEAAAALDSLIASAQSLKDWAGLEKYSGQRLTLAKHADGFDYRSLMKYGKLLFEAAVKNGDQAKVKETVRELTQRLPTSLPVRDLYELAAMQVEVGAKSDAMHTLESLQPVCHSRNNAHMLPEIAKLYRRLSEEEHAQRAQDEYMTAHLRAIEADLRKKADDERKRATGTNITGPGAPALDCSRTGAAFPQVEFISDAYKFNYVALASDSLTLDGNAKVAISSGPGTYMPYTFAATYGKLRTRENPNHSGILSFVVDCPSFAYLKPPPRETAIDGASSAPGGPPPAMSLPFKPGIAIPKDCQVLSGEERELVLKPGDYSTTGLYLDSLIIPRVGGKVRIFIKETTPDGLPVFVARPQSFINANTGFGPANQGQLLEIWYAGAGTIRLDSDSAFSGIIYAPNARVEIGPGKARFTGAIVARDIYACGDSVLTFNENLNGWTAP